MKTIIFDIKTIPDLDAGRRLYGKPAAMSSLSDEDVGRVMALERLRSSDGHSSQLYPSLQRIIAVAVVSADTPQGVSLGTADSSEAELLRAVFALLPGQCVSWERQQLDVLQYRALVHGIPAPAYWQQTPRCLQSELAAQAVPLHEVGKALGVPVTREFSADTVWETWLEGGIETVREACLGDARLAYTVWLRYQLIRGELDAAEYQARLTQLGGA